MRIDHSAQGTKLTRRAALKAAAATSVYAAIAACTPTTGTSSSGAPSVAGASKTPGVKPDITLIDGAAPTSLDQAKSGEF
jgi:hypothetical protein